MLPRTAAVLLLAAGLRGCITYEYEHEFWLNVDGSGTVHVTGRPALWTAFKGLSRTEDADGASIRRAAQALFERAGLDVNRVTLTRRGGRRYLFVSADFEDVNRLGGSTAFPDLRISLKKTGDRLRLSGTWSRPARAHDIGAFDRDGLMAVRFHLPSKVYEHRNAADGVERGNILAWRQDVAEGLDGASLEFGAVMDERSILFSTVVLFGGAILLAAGIVGGLLHAVARRGRREMLRPDPGA
jgi:hypothetical protein